MTTQEALGRQNRLLKPRAPKLLPFLVTLEERNGEHEYNQQTIVEAATLIEAQAKAEEAARTWYDYRNVEAGDGGYYFFAGCIHVQVDNVEPLTKSEAKTLQRFLR